MALNITRKRESIRNKSGGILKVQEVDESGADLTPRATVVDLGYLENSEFEDKTPSKNLEDESGAVVAQELGVRSVSLKCTLMQTDKNVLNIPKEVRGKFYRVFKFSGNVDSTAQETWFGVGTITPQINVKFSGGRVPWEYICSENDTAISIDTTTQSLFGSVNRGTISIPAGDYYTIVGG